MSRTLRVSVLALALLGGGCLFRPIPIPPARASDASYPDVSQRDGGMAEDGSHGEFNDAGSSDAHAPHDGGSDAVSFRDVLPDENDCPDDGGASVDGGDAACAVRDGGPADAPADDASEDAGVDAGVDADAGEDAGVDADVDAGEPDGGDDASGGDAGAEGDAASGDGEPGDAHDGGETDAGGD